MSPFLLAAGWLLTAGGLRAQWVDVTTEYLLQVSCAGSQFGCGLSCADFNGDGLDDLTFARSSGDVSLYARNAGGFELVQQFSGEEDANAILWVDVDGDGDLDLFFGQRNHGVSLYIRTASGALVNQGALRGVPNWSGWRPRGISAADFDRDDDLDIYIASYHVAALPDPHPNVLLINDGTGFFTVADDSVGVNDGIQTTFHGGWLDYDRDGWMDLWVINDRQSFVNALYRNQGDGTFVDVAPELGLDTYLDPMTATIFDPDHDGDWDLFSTEVTNFPHQFFENRDSVFVDVADSVGVGGTYDYGWGGCVVDVDGDTHEDLMVATLFWPTEAANNNRIYMGQDSGLHFVEDASGWPNEQLALYHLGRFDLDGDRAPDVVGYGVPPVAQVLRNADGAGHSRMTVRLVGTTTNSHAVGALIEVHYGPDFQMQQVDAGCDFQTQHSYTRFFGMGSTQTVDSIVVTWPSGVSETWTEMSAEAAHTLIQGTAHLQPLALDRDCPWHPQGWVLPQLPGNGVWSWEGNPPLSDTLWVEDGEAHTLLASWWGGRYSLSWTLQVEWEAIGDPQFEVVPPACFGDATWVSWTAVGADSVLWQDGIPFPVDTAIQVMDTLVQVAWQYGPTCWIDTAVTVDIPPALSVALDVGGPVCAGDAAVVDVTVQGGTPPWEVAWFGADPDALEGGVWPVLVTDASGCQLLDSVEVITYDSLQSNLVWSYLNGGDSVQVLLEVVGGLAPYSVWWSGAVDQDGIVVAPATVGWLVMDAIGCLSQGVMNIGTNGLEAEGNGHLSSLLCQRVGGVLRFSGPDLQGSISIVDLTGRICHSGPWKTPCEVSIGWDAPVLITVRTDSGMERVYLR